MKQFVTLLSLIFLVTFYSHATILTVSNNVQIPAQFATIQAAVNAAVAGDTIYVNASVTIYSENVQITKRLVLIGGGYKSSNQLNYKTSVNRLALPYFGGADNPSGSVICGFDVQNGISSFSAGSSPINNIRIFRNRTAGVQPYGSNWEIYNNIIIGTCDFFYSVANIFIRNNIFSGTFITGQSFNPPSILIDHNVFLRTGSQTLNNVQFATITNNIFAFSSTSGFVIDAGTKNNNFNNNLCTNTTVSAVAPFNSFASNTNTEAGNFVGVDPQFVNVTNLGNYDENANYRLQSTSPARNAGTDGTDLGIYGGSYPFPSGGTPGGGFDTSALPPIPQVTSVNIQNGTLAPGAQLKVTIQATVNN
jgi:hypothetical protein